jgi:chemotaxis protein MotD
VKGINASLGSPSILPDARAKSTGAKPADPAGAQPDHGQPGDFGGHLAGLSRLAGKPGDAADLAGLRKKSTSATAQQSFLLAAGTADAKRQAGSVPETAMPDFRSTIASPLAGVASADGANLRIRFVTSPDGGAAQAPVSTAAAVSRGIGRDALAKSMQALGEGASFAEGERLPASHRAVSGGPRNSHAPGPGGADAFLTSPLAPGSPLQGAFTAASEAKDAVSNETAASVNPALAGAAGGSIGMEPLPARLPTRSGGAAAMIAGSARAPAAMDARGLAPRAPLPGLGERRFDSAAAQRLAGPASRMPEPNGGYGPDFVALAPGGVLVLDQQTHLAPANRLSPDRRIAQSKLGPPPGPAPLDPIETARLSAESGRDRAAPHASVEPQANHGPDPNGNHDLDLASSAVVKGAVVSPPTGVAPFNGPAEQIAKVVVAGTGPGILDGGPATARTNRARDMEGMAKSPPSMSRVQTMQLQLDPGTLGKVTVRMRLSGSRLDLRVETERPETMQLIGSDKDLLTGKLQAAGFTIETLVIQTAEPQGPPQSITHANGQPQSTGQANGGPSAHDRPSTQDDRQRSRPNFADDAQDGADARRRGGDLYL